MTRRHGRRLIPATRAALVRIRSWPAAAATLAGFAIASVGFAGAASAATPWQHFHDTYQEIDENFCDVPGLTVQLDSTTDGRDRYTPRGPDRLPYYMQHATDTNVYTNVATGESVTEVELRNENDVRVTDNRDGTLTYIHKNVHKMAMYNEDDKAIAHRTGQLLVELVFDHNGTPTDPSDDQFVSIRILQSATHGDDFCTALVEAIG